MERIVPDAVSLSSVLDRLDRKSLRLFAMIREEGAMARRAAIAPSAVSKRLAEMERALGCKLLTREPKGMRPTPAGETLLHHTRRMLAGAEQIALEFTEHARGSVRVLANLSAIVRFLPEDRQEFLAVQPGIRVDREERPSHAVVTGIAEGAADLGICARGREPDPLMAYPYRNDRLVLVVPATHPLAERDGVALSEALDYDYVGLHRESAIHAALHAEARRLGRPLRLRIHVPGFDAICRMAQAGMGLGVVPERVHAILGTSDGSGRRAPHDSFARRTLSLVDPARRPAARCRAPDR